MYIVAFYYYTEPGKNRISYAGRYEDGLLEVAAARCSDKDEFSKKKARWILDGRLALDKLLAVREIAECKTEDFIKVCQEYTEELQKDMTKVKPWKNN